MREIWTRLRNDAHLAIISTAGMLGLISITPFAFYRLLQRDWLVVAVDSLLLAITSFALFISWRYGRSQQAGQILAVLYGMAAVVIAIRLPGSGLFWFYCVILFSYFVTSPVRSTLVIFASLATLCGYASLHPGEVFTDLQQMIIFATTCAVSALFAFMFAWRTAQQRRLLQDLASRDPLTGVGNRRTLTSEMDIALANYKRHGTACGLLLLDLDHFKRINDRDGHAEGDRVLVEFALLTRNTSRRTDRLFRLGGEEFVLLLPNIDRAGLEAAARNIVKTVAAHLRSTGGPVTVSIGGALLESGEDSIRWLHKADICLYQAKNQGRNRSVIHSSEQFLAEQTIP